ncbi:MAG: DUF3795 domain-containing protein [Desulfarculaceae bacterium]|nr:DUF3795 domain-containing protein [Desulfarculaceae bacterium]MCF8073471.1 DUF3795 domain-containing protein [Desulfarculaceae bacterium]MCF8100382.1 DUF3795 domain-containing protein [Desulfarculaceae bacterium]MCF8115882.1 DUF3795 domain-containing protein [Desulfarculaceae bacterium]
MSDIACCGLDCGTCPAHRAWQEDDDELRKSTAAEWSRLYQAEISPEQINCQGCRVGQEPMFGHCQVCAVRACVMDKGWENCAPCPDYPCKDLSFIQKFSAQAKQALDQLRPGDVS